jgi:hypothetical protein
MNENACLPCRNVGGQRRRRVSGNGFLIQGVFEN